MCTSLSERSSAYTGNYDGAFLCCWLLLLLLLPRPQTGGSEERTQWDSFVPLFHPIGEKAKQGNLEVNNLWSIGGVANAVLLHRGLRETVSCFDRRLLLESDLKVGSVFFIGMHHLWTYSIGDSVT